MSSHHPAGRAEESAKTFSPINPEKLFDLRNFNYHTDPFYTEGRASLLSPWQRDSDSEPSWMPEEPANHAGAAR